MDGTGKFPEKLLIFVRKQIKKVSNGGRNLHLDQFFCAKRKLKRLNGASMVRYKRSYTLLTYKCGHFCDLWGIPNQKYGCQTQAFFSVFQCSLDYRGYFVSSKLSNLRFLGVTNNHCREWILPIWFSLSKVYFLLFKILEKLLILLPRNVLYVFWEWHSYAEVIYFLFTSWVKLRC